MSRRVLALGLSALAALAGCKSAGGPPPAAGPGPLADAARALVGQQRILRFDGKKKDVAIDVREARRSSGPCDVAVEIKAASLANGVGQFVLDPIGQPRLEGRSKEKAGKKWVCRDYPAQTVLRITGLGTTADSATADVAKVLLTVEGYLAANGLALDRPPGPAPKDVADPTLTAGAESQRLAREITAPQRLLLAVDPVYRSPNRKIHYEGQVDFAAVVGTDGRIHQPRLSTTLGDHEPRVLRALPLWRYDPAQRGDAPVAVRISEKTVFRIF